MHVIPVVLVQHVVQVTGEDSQLRVRMTPDGSDDWSFDLRLTLGFADGTSRSFFWTDVRLDNAAPERTLALAPARLP